MKGYVTHENLRLFSDKVCELERTQYCHGHGDHLEVEILLDDDIFGCPEELRDLMKSYEVSIIDFSHVNSTGLTLYIEEN